MVRPKTIYYYEHKELIRHRVADCCLTEIVSQEPDGPRYRCRCYREGLAGTVKAHDIYGYASLKQAKALEIKEARSRIYDEQEWLRKLQG